MTPEFEAYIAAHTSPEPPLLHELYRDTHLRRLYSRMCSGHVQGRWLAMLASMIKPRRALELGTFSGYSALCLAEGMGQGSHLDTIEIDDEAEDFIREYFDRSPLGSRISLHIGDALELIPLIARANGEKWDLVYIDANKRHYCAYLDAILPHISDGGFIIADNTLWSGKVADTADHPDAQTRGIVDFNNRVARDPHLSVVILPVRDGLSIIRVNS